jgi:Ca-activated chloride channel family protein
MFGDAKQSQLDELAVASRGRVFDGRTSLAAAFRTVKGYN